MFLQFQFLFPYSTKDWITMPWKEMITLLYCMLLNITIVKTFYFQYNRWSITHDTRVKTVKTSGFLSVPLQPNRAPAFCTAFFNFYSHSNPHTLFCLGNEYHFYHSNPVFLFRNVVNTRRLSLHTYGMHRTFFNRHTT